MKKILVTILLTFILSSCNETTNAPEPNLIPFEKQEVLSSYDFRIIESTGRVINLYAKQNKVTLIHYWKPSTENISDDLEIIQKLYDDYKLKIEFYFITDDTQPKVRSFIEQNNLLFPNYYIGATPPRPLKFESSPKTYLFSKTGRIVINQEGIANWNSDTVRKTIDDLLKQ